MFVDLLSVFYVRCVHFTCCHVSVEYSFISFTLWCFVHIFICFKLKLFFRADKVFQTNWSHKLTCNSREEHRSTDDWPTLNLQWICSWVYELSLKAAQPTVCVQCVFCVCSVCVGDGLNRNVLYEVVGLTDECYTHTHPVHSVCVVRMNQSESSLSQLLSLNVCRWTEFNVGDL